MKPKARESVEKIFCRAEKEKRNFLLEHEVYTLLRSLGFRTPRFLFIRNGDKAVPRELERLMSREVVLKVVSPQIIHKSDVGGVVFSENAAAAVNRAIRSMLAEVKKRLAVPDQKTKSPGRGGDAVELRGVLVIERVNYENVGFGSELLLGIRNSREFGPVVTMGLGGLDVEYINERLKPGKAVAVASAHLSDKKDLANLLRPLAFYDKLVRGFRGKDALLEEMTLVEGMHRFLQLAADFSAYSRRSPFVIEEAEVNPFVTRKGTLLPLDGMCRFSRNKAAGRPDIFDNIDFLLHPQSVGLIGVSERMNLGHIILNNVLREGFPKERIYVVKPGLEEIEGCRCVPTIGELPVTVDLFVLTLAADQSVGFMESLLAEGKARSVIIIAGGMGEKKGSEVLEQKIKDLLSAARREGRPAPVVNGGNCMGIYSGPGKYDTTFIPEHKLAAPGKDSPRVVYISQSGAFMASRLSKIPQLEPLYAISLGNQIDLAASDYLNYFKTKPLAPLYALYIEGFQPGDGLALAAAAREIVGKGSTVLVYKGGRTAEGRQATSSHTASVAGDYAVCRAVLESAGVFLAETISEFEQALRTLPALSGKTASGRRVGLVSNAGFECVILADSLKNGYDLDLSVLDPATGQKIAALLRPLGIDRLQDVRNPLDLTPVADDAVFAGCVEALIADENVDCAVISPVPMTAALQTLAPAEVHRENIHDPQSVGRRMIEIIRTASKPVVANIDAGALYNPLATMLEEAGVPVFRRSDESLRFLAKYVQASLRARELRRRISHRREG
jgi:acyl-CoA synthetase (NDP forming)